MGGSSTKPELNSHIHDKKVRHGEDIEFRCEANLEDLEVKWRKDGQRLYSGGRITIRQNGTNLSLKITGAKEEDEGKYTVTLSNESDSVSDSAKVTVLEYDRMWRSIDWGVNVEIRHSLQDLKPRNPQVKHLRILLHGPVGSGKSSIINSINSIFQDTVKVGALAASVAGTSFTKMYKTYQIRDRQNRALPFVFNDIMGLENDSDEGVLPEDIISAIEGHVQENYKFNPKGPLLERHPCYNHRPTVNDKVHCLVSVIPADKITLMDDEVIEKMQDIREHASDLRIPQVIFMTCVDLACTLVKDDLQRIYRSKLIKKKMKECSNKLGVPMNCIFPVKNYHEENNLDPNMDSLILDALKNVVNFANDYAETLETDPQPSQLMMHKLIWPDLSEPSDDEQSEDSSPGKDECSQNELDSFNRQENSSQDEPDSSFRPERVNWCFSAPSGVKKGDSMPVVTPADREFDLEWRKAKWDIGSRNRMEKELREFRLLNPDLKHLRILLHGPVGAGKSSFINSINSVFQGHICAGALVAAESGISFTKKYRTHKFRNGNSGHLPFVVNDIMGLEKGNSVGAHPKDIISALLGHVKNNYQFKSDSPLSAGDANYVDSPSLSDRVHCLVSVIPLDKVSIMDDDVINKMRAIREAASDMDIPQVIVMTMADRACPVVQEDLRKIYFSKRIKQNMQECSNRLGIPMNCIFPVKNYHDETDLDQEIDCLILTALRQIVNFAHEYIDSLD